MVKQHVWKIPMYNLDGTPITRCPTGYNVNKAHTRCDRKKPPKSTGDPEEDFAIGFQQYRAEAGKRCKLLTKEEECSGQADTCKWFGSSQKCAPQWGYSGKKIQRYQYTDDGKINKDFRGAGDAADDWVEKNIEFGDERKDDRIREISEAPTDAGGYSSTYAPPTDAGGDYDLPPPPAPTRRPSFFDSLPTGKADTGAGYGGSTSTSWNTPETRRRCEIHTKETDCWTDKSCRYGVKTCIPTNPATEPASFWRDALIAATKNKRSTKKKSKKKKSSVKRCSRFAKKGSKKACRSVRKKSVKKSKKKSSRKC